MIKIEINGSAVEAGKGEMLLAAIRRAGINIPTLCNIDGLPATGACRLCVVEVEGQRGLVPSCAFPVVEGMKVLTHSPKAVQARKTIVELLLADHPDDCLYCIRNGNCQLQALAEELGVRERRYAGAKTAAHQDVSSPSIERDPEKCILCGKCVRVCEEVQGVSAIDFAGRGSRTRISTAFEKGMNTSSCVFCGQCVTACPTGALREQSSLKQVQEALSDPEKYVVFQHAPAISVTLGEAFGLSAGVDVAGVMTAAIRRLGADRVFDTSFAADLTIMEEGSELVHRIKNGGVLPMMTSCSPAWIRFVEQFYPEFIPNLSSCKSPQQMMGAVIKSYFAETQGIDPRKIFTVSVMPCTAKKYEASRPEMGKGGVPDIDAVLTTRELARMIRMRGLDLAKLEPEGADTPFGERTTAGKIFGATGGVMEAAIRSAYYLITGRELDKLEVEAVRGTGIREAKLDINGMKVGVAVASGLGNARKLLESIRSGVRSDIHFIEIMSCPGGCVSGGGQLYGSTPEKIVERMKGLYKLDRNEGVRVSHRNESVMRLYKEYLKEPLGKKSHELLHTKYKAKPVRA
jgi:NADH-quinone oxidoreductase subunit G/NADP-reducing hydrogenase subunit HndD